MPDEQESRRVAIARALAAVEARQPDAVTALSFNDLVGAVHAELDGTHGNIRGALRMLLRERS